MVRLLRGLRSLPALALGWASAMQPQVHMNDFGNPLPKMPHRYIAPSAMKSRCVIVGDVHGCFDELQDLLTKVNYSSEDCTLILVGDLVNKGPKSVEVVQYCRENDVLAVRGNHDEACLNHAMNKGWKAIPEKYDYVHHLLHDDIAWLQELPYTLDIPLWDAIVVHAGLVPGVPLCRQNTIDMVTMRNVIPTPPADGGAAEKALPMEYTASPTTGTGEAWAGARDTNPHVYFGHDAVRALQRHSHATGLDTGACYGGGLTCVVLPGNDIVSVPSRMIYEEAKAKGL